MPVATLLNAASANTTGPVAGFGTPTGNLTVAVSTTGTVSAFSVQVQGSVDGTQWANVGSAVTSVTAGTSIGTGVLYQYFQALLSSYSGTGTVTVRLAYSLGAGAGGLPPPTGVAAGSYTNAGITVGADGRLTAASSGSASGMGNPMTTAGDLIDGGTGGTPARLAGNTSATKNYLTSTGTGSAAQAPAWGTIAANDVPTLNQNTSGTAAGLSATLAVGSGGTGQISASAAFNALSPNAALGDLTYGSGTNTSTNLAGNTSATKKFLTETGNGTISAAPGWNTIAAGDVPQLADYAPTGLTGATAAARFVGATTSGAPVSGTFATGDMLVDQTGAIWVCTAGGTPGTWPVPLGKQAAYAHSASQLAQALTAGAWTLFSTGLTVTLPNDGGTYRVELTIPQATLSTSTIAHIGIGSSISVLYADTGMEFPTAQAGGWGSIAVTGQKVTGSGQTVSIYGLCVSAYTLTLWPGASAIELAAYRVA